MWNKDLTQLFKDTCKEYNLSEIGYVKAEFSQPLYVFEQVKDKNVFKVAYCNHKYSDNDTLRFEYFKNNKIQQLSQDFIIRIETDLIDKLSEVMNRINSVVEKVK